jgi:hypothetical protein
MPGYLCPEKERRILISRNTGTMLLPLLALLLRGNGGKSGAGDMPDKKVYSDSFRITLHPNNRYLSYPRRGTFGLFV